MSSTAIDVSADITSLSGDLTVAGTITEQNSI
jgi:hypothetical protein